MQGQAPLAFVDEDGDIRINFGIFAGRDATQAEIDELARTLLDEVPAVTVVAENRVVADRESEAAVHQIRIECGGEDPGNILPLTEQWASACVAERRAEI
jgi:hypothetical protein